MKNCNEVDLTDRIRSLNSEWDTERILEVNASALLILSSYLGIRTSRIWFVITAFTGVFMMQHALWGWCPPLPLLRKWGVRTEDEINSEKIVLKLLRGDFKEEGSSVVDLLNTVEKQ